MQLTPSKTALSRAAARVVGSRFAKPATRVVLAAAALVVLALVGHTAVSGALAASPAASPASASVAVAGPIPSPPAPVTTTPATPPADPPPNAAVRAAATPENPVVLNTATEGDLRRLPGIGAKRAQAILDLRARLGRLHAVEDLLKVKGIGRATLKRLRPLVRLDSGPPDAGALPRPTSSSQ